ncbi:DEAD/DEAH box helicase family protein [Sorangium sp. So ce388]|uniref:DEAD/DEAH box helicase family protein n=1 Tax=Sorangium sp. So ce388 TaxID=3133309 RepID=UPI003F5B6D74
MSGISEWERDYDLNEARKHPSKKAEAPHQTEALAKLRAWYEAAPTPDAGGLLVLPTGGGKTFTAVRFLCRNPLSDGYKVLWLAHTHHLLEQALDGFGKRSDGADEMEVGLIHEPKDRLRARVVSGTLGHSKIAAVRRDDDVVICTLQTAVRAYREKHAALGAFLAAAKGKLMVVFDEAHHAPAPSYTEFLLALRKEAPKMKLLGLTATPMYNDKKGEGWLAKLFPQRILFEVSAAKLMAMGILAKPIPIPCDTKFEPKFDAGQLQRWRTTYQDVPEEIITQLAKNQQRNDTIWKTYVDRRKEFGKTIIFADRWFQCDYLREKLLANGVRADVMYTHVEAKLSSVEARNQRSRDSNAAVLRKFHDNKLDVLINVRMLTEGTDVPNVQSVFLTRQTTSPILLRQMVGRALRGPKFGGTASANIVLFMDEWREAIQWAEFEDVWGTGTDKQKSEPRKRLPLQLVSIALIRQLARWIELGEMAPASFLEMLPLGWYLPEFDVEVSGSEDTEHVRPMVLVYGDEKEHYEAFIAHVAKTDLGRFADPLVQYDAVETQMERWCKKFFAPAGKCASGLGMNLFHLVRHLAQTGGKPPPFAPFEHREEHDLTPLAKVAAAEDWGPSRTRQHLEAIYLDERRFWRAMIPTFDLFRDQFRMLVEAEIQRKTGAGGVTRPGRVIAPTPQLVDQEPSEDVKREVIRRDGERCLCCGETRRKRLQVDHIISRYHGGTNEPFNLQTLCSVCNRDKDIQEMHFRKTETSLKSAPPLKFPAGFDSADIDQLARDVQRTINMFYQCAAVDEIEMKSKGIKRREWRIRLRSNNPRAWFEGHLDALFGRVVKAQEGGRSAPVRSIVLEAPGNADGFCVYSRQIGPVEPLPATAIRPRNSVAVYWPLGPGLPNQPIPAKVIRIDARKRQADVRLTIGRAESELKCVPFDVLFAPDAVHLDDEDQE